MHLKMSNL
jgi:hypothetical protein